MDEEDEQIDSKEFPGDEYLRPVEGKETVVYRTPVVTVSSSKINNVAYGAFIVLSTTKVH